jgi:hypothetical protein
MEAAMSIFPGYTTAEILRDIWRGFVTLGGLAFIKQIYDWSQRNPRLIGDIEMIITGRELTPAGNYVDAHVMLAVYVVNRRIKPTTVRGMAAYAHIGGDWKRGTMRTIPDGFKLSEMPEIDFSKSRLYEKMATNLLEYGRGVHGWLRVSFPNEPVEQVQGMRWRIELVDAFGSKHVIEPKDAPRKMELGYIPDAGVTHGS